ncbi:MAG: hypothetical protein U9R44_03920 [Candidatus Omnitrophota bacterium]|nr:hypothetical protein [Candidatus Omnitrophota bacterium]
MLNKSTRFLISVALMVMFCFLDARAVSVDPSSVPAPGQLRKLSLLDAETFILPQDLGTVKYSNKGVSNVVIIHIQDAHCNYAAQMQISKIIDYLNTEYGIGHVNLEGGTGEYDLSVFTDMYDKGIRSRVADYFVKWGEINGAELFALNNPGKVSLWGAEDAGLYLRNLDVYRDSLAYTDEVNKYMKELRHFIGNLKRRIFSEELMEIDRNYTRYKTNELEFKDYLEFLFAKARQKGIDVRSLTNLYLLKQSMDEEDRIDFRRANNQREELIGRLKEFLSKNELEELVLKTVEFKNKRISQKEFYEYLAKKAGQTRQGLENFPELQKYIIYISLYEAVDKSGVVEEMEQLEARIKETVYQNDRQKELDRLSKTLVLTGNMFGILLTVEDYEYYKKNKDDFEVSNFVSFIRKEAPVCGIKAKLDDSIGRLDVFRERICRFYECSFERDEAFLENIRVSGGETQAGILVTGGFHAENLLGLLKEKDISYVSIIPNFEIEEGFESRYFSILSGGISPFEETLNSALSTIQVPSPLNRLIMETDGPGRAERFRMAVIALEAMYSEGAARAFGLNDGRYVVFYVENNEPIVDVLSSGEFREKFGDVELVAEDIDIDNINRGLSEIGQDWIVRNSRDRIYLGEGSTAVEDSRRILEAIGDANLIAALNDLMGRKGYYEEDGNWVEITGTDREGNPYSAIQIIGELGSAHAGGQGIYFPAGLSDKELVETLLHELVASVYAGNMTRGLDGHDLSSGVEKAFKNVDIRDAGALRAAAEAAMEFLERAERYTGMDGVEKTIQQITAEERFGLNRDFAAMFFSRGAAKWFASLILEAIRYAGRQDREVPNWFKTFEDELKSRSEKAEDYQERIEEIKRKLDRYGDQTISEVLISALDFRSLDDLLGALESALDTTSLRPEIILQMVRPAKSADMLRRFVEIGSVLPEKDLRRIFNVRATGKYLRERIERERDAVDRAVVPEENRYFNREGNSEDKIFMTRSSMPFLEYVSRFDYLSEEMIKKLRTMEEEMPGRGTEFLLGLTRAYNLNEVRFEERKARLRTEVIDNALKNKQRLEGIKDELKEKNGRLKWGELTGDEKARLEGEIRDLEDEGAEILKNFKGPGIVNVNETNYMKQPEYQRGMGDLRQGHAEFVKRKILEQDRLFEVVGAIKNGEISMGNTVSVDNNLVADPRKYRLMRLKKSAVIPVSDVDGVEHGIGKDGTFWVRHGAGETRPLLVEGKKVAVKLVAGEDFKDVTGKRIKKHKYFESAKKPGIAGEWDDELDGIILRESDGALSVVIREDSNIPPALIKAAKLIVDIVKIQDERTRDEAFKDLLTIPAIQEFLSDRESPETKREAQREILYWENIFSLFPKDESLRTRLLIKYWNEIKQMVFPPSAGEEMPMYAMAGGSSAIGNIVSEAGKTLADLREMDIEDNGKTLTISDRPGAGPENRLRDGKIEVDLAGIEKESSELRGMLEGFINERIDESTLTSDEVGELTDLLEMLSDASVDRVVGLDDHENLLGLFNEKVLYLNKDLMDDPLALLHELGEGGIRLPDGYEGLTRHTYMRGVGKDVRTGDELLAADIGTEAVEGLSAEERIRGIKNKMREAGLRPMAGPEEALINYNYDNREEPVKGRVLAGAKGMLEGLQGKLDPARNLEFTRRIGDIVASLRRGTLNIVLIPSTNVEILSAQENLSRKVTRRFRGMGINTIVMHYDPDNPGIKIDRALKEAGLEKNKKLFPNIYIYTQVKAGEEVPAEIREAQEKYEELMVIGKDILDAGMDVGDVQVDEIKIIAVANALLNDKRLKENFGYSAEDMEDMRRENLVFFRTSGFFDGIEVEGGLDFESMRAGDLERFMEKLFKGKIPMRITRVNWEEIRFWQDAQEEVLRSL